MQKLVNRDLSKDEKIKALSEFENHPAHKKIKDIKPETSHFPVTTRGASNDGKEMLSYVNYSIDENSQIGTSYLENGLMD